MEELEGIIILGVALAIITTISAIRGIHGRIQLAAAEKRRALLEQQQGRARPNRMAEPIRRAA